MNDGITVAQLLGATVDEIQARARVAIVYLVITIPLGALSLFFENDAAGILSGNLGFLDAFSGQILLGVVVGAAYMVVLFMADYWLTAGMVRQTDAPSFDRFLPFVGIYILAVLGMMLGFLLLIVPGIILVVRWLPLLPAVIDRDEAAMDSFADSWEMTRGSGWSIFGVFLLTVIAAITIAVTIVGAASSFGGAGSPAAIILESVVDGLSSVFFIALAVAAYRLLNPDRNRVEDVFE